MNENTPNLSIVPRRPTRTPPIEISNPKDLVGEVELAARLGVSRSTLQSWRYNGRGPRFIKIGRLVRYRYADVEVFLAGCTPENRA